MPTTRFVSTCDLSDSGKLDQTGDFRVMAPLFRDFGGLAHFAGRAATVRCLDDNSLVKAAVETPGNGRVLVVDGGGSLQRALLGGTLAAAAAANGWSGVVIYGCVRDVAELALLPIGIRALAPFPMPCIRRGLGESDVEISVAGTRVRPGDWVYADADGIVVSSVALALP